ncbi:MAG: alpha/beta hydrolase, partial [Cloacibacillus porcorum]
MKMIGLTMIITAVLAVTAMAGVACAADMSNGADNFYRSGLVTMEKVVFKNLYRMDVAGSLFTPKNMSRGAKYPAIVVGHPMGAVKEQSANL